MKRLILPIVFFSLIQSAYGQHWTRVSQPYTDSVASNVGEAFSPYFINPDTGFVFYPFLSGSFASRYTDSVSNLQRTTDGGSSWDRITMFDDSGWGISQICFVSKNEGYVAATNDAHLSGGIFRTTDAGLHWQRISKSSPFYSVYATRNSVFAISPGIGEYFRELYFSHDDGLTWDSVTTVSGHPLPAPSLFWNLYGNRDSLVVASWGEFKFAFIYSTDLGTTWQNGPDVVPGHPGGNFPFFTFIQPHACNLIQDSVDESDVLDDTYSFFGSSISTQSSWIPSLEHRETGAFIAGNSCAIYLSDAADGHGADPDTSVMLFRSSDEGNSWQSIQRQPGVAPSFTEIDDDDYPNLAVVGHGAVVYADSFGFYRDSALPVYSSLWKTTDGGDGTFSAAVLAPKLALAHAAFPSGTDTLNVPTCGSQMVVTNFNIGCSWAAFDSVTIDGLTPDEYSVTSTHYCGCTHLPDTSFITLAPTQSGIRNVIVHFHYTDDEYNQIDTALAMVLDVKSGGVRLPLSLSLGSGTMIARAGDTIGIPVYLTSDSTITLDTIAMLLPFVLDTNVLNVLGFVPAFGSDTLDSLQYVGGTAIVPLRIKDLTISGKTLIGTLRCVVYLVDTLRTSVTLQGASIDANTGGCIMLSTNLSGVNIALTGCGDSTLLKFIQTREVALGIEDINPDPAQNILHVHVMKQLGDILHYGILNTLGKEIAEVAFASDDPALDVSSLPDGIYLLVVTSPSGFVTFRKFIVNR